MIPDEILLDAAFDLLDGSEWGRDCVHRTPTHVPYGSGSVLYDVGEPCEECVACDAIAAAERAVDEGVLGWDPTGHFLERGGSLLRGYVKTSE